MLSSEHKILIKTCGN